MTVPSHHITLDGIKSANAEGFKKMKALRKARARQRAELRRIIDNLNPADEHTARIYHFPQKESK